MPPTSSPISSHSPVCTPMRTSIPSSRAAPVIASAQRSARDGGPSKVARKPSPTVLTSRPPKRASSLRSVLVVAREQVAPAAVAELRGARRRVDDVGEHHREQRPRQLAAAAPAGEELLDLFDDRVAVADERERVGPLQLDVARAGNVLREVARVAHVPHELAGPVHDQRRHADPRQRVAHVEIDHRPRDGPRLARAGGEALHAREPRGQRRVVGHRRRPQRHRGAVGLAPGGEIALVERLALLAGHRPVVVRSPRGARDRRIHDQRADPLGVVRGEQRPDESSDRVGHQRRAFAAGGVEHRERRPRPPARACTSRARDRTARSRGCRTGSGG